MNSCCEPKTKNKKNIFLAIIYGLIPHAFCIAFILLSIIGTTIGASIIKKFLLIPYFFEILIGLSLVMATLSSAIYLKRQNLLSSHGLKTKWKYLTLMYSITLLVNVFMFLVVFPTMANINNSKSGAYASVLPSGILKVQIPCSGHAPLIISEIKKDSGVESVFFKMPDTFNIRYNPNVTSLEKIASLDIFKSFKATIQ